MGLSWIVLGYCMRRFSYQGISFLILLFFSFNSFAAWDCDAARAYVSPSFTAGSIMYCGFPGDLYKSPNCYYSDYWNFEVSRTYRLNMCSIEFQGCFGYVTDQFGKPYSYTSKAMCTQVADPPPCETDGNSNDTCQCQCEDDNPAVQNELICVQTRLDTTNDGIGGEQHCDYPCPRTPQMSGYTADQFIRHDSYVSNKQYCLLDCADGSYSVEFEGEYTCMQCPPDSCSMDVSAAEYAPQCCEDVSPDCGVNPGQSGCPTCDEYPFLDSCRLRCKFSDPSIKPSYCNILEDETPDCSLYPAHDKCKEVPNFPCGDPLYRGAGSVCEDYCSRNPGADICKPTIDCTRHSDDPMCRSWCVDGGHRMEDSCLVNCAAVPGQASCLSVEDPAFISCNDRPDDPACVDPAAVVPAPSKPVPAAPAQTLENPATGTGSDPCNSLGDGFYRCMGSTGTIYHVPAEEVECRDSNSDGTVSDSECYTVTVPDISAPVTDLPSSSFDFPLNPFTDLTGGFFESRSSDCPVFEFDLTGFYLSDDYHLDIYYIDSHCKLFNDEFISMIRLIFMITFIFSAFWIVLEA